MRFPSDFNFRFNRRLRIGTLATGTIVAGLLWRFAIPGLPWFFWKYGGSLLWASLIYFLLALCAPRTNWRYLLLVGIVIVTAVEFSRLYHDPALDAFRLTLAGKLILGKVFSLWNLPAYYLGLLLAAGVDRQLEPAS